MLNMTKQIELRPTPHVHNVDNQLSFNEMCKLDAYDVCNNKAEMLGMCPLIDTQMNKRLVQLFAYFK